MPVFTVKYIKFHLLMPSSVNIVNIMRSSLPSIRFSRSIQKNAFPGSSAMCVSRDKSPYRANMWLALRRICRDWKSEPTHFFKIFPDLYQYGMGFYSAPRDTMEELRQPIEKKNKKFRYTISFCACVTESRRVPGRAHPAIDRINSIA